MYTVLKTDTSNQILDSSIDKTGLLSCVEFLALKKKVAIASRVFAFIFFIGVTLYFLFWPFSIGFWSAGFSFVALLLLGQVVEGLLLVITCPELKRYYLGYNLSIEGSYWVEQRYYRKTGQTGIDRASNIHRASSESLFKAALFTVVGIVTTIGVLISEM